MGFIHHDCTQFGKQHSRYKAILPSTVLSQQCCELVEYTSSLLQQWPCSETQLPNIAEITSPNLIGWTCPCCSSPRYIPGFCDWVVNNKGMIKTVHYKQLTNKLTIDDIKQLRIAQSFFRCALIRCKELQRHPSKISNFAGRFPPRFDLRCHAVYFPVKKWIQCNIFKLLHLWRQSQKICNP